MAQTPQEMYYSLPPLTRTFLTVAVGTTLLATFGMVNPAYLMFDWRMLVYKFQFWRLITPFTFFGPFSLPFLFNMFIMVRYTRQYEQDPYSSAGGNASGTLADAIWMVFLGMLFLDLIGGYVMGLPFMPMALVFMIIYVWSRRNPDAPASFWGFHTFGIYIPWIFVAFSFLLSGGKPPVLDLLGIAAGHIYYLLQDVIPNMENSLSGGKGLLPTPSFIYDLFNVYNPNAVQTTNRHRIAGAFQGQARRPGGR